MLAGQGINGNQAAGGFVVKVSPMSAIIQTFALTTLQLPFFSPLQETDQTQGNLTAAKHDSGWICIGLGPVQIRACLAQGSWNLRLL